MFLKSLNVSCEVILYQYCIILVIIILTVKLHYILSCIDTFDPTTFKWNLIKKNKTPQ